MRGPHAEGSQLRPAVHQRNGGSAGGGDEDLIVDSLPMIPAVPDIRTVRVGQQPPVDRPAAFVQQGQGAVGFDGDPERLVLHCVLG